jgi:hypothetical protein
MQPHRSERNRRRARAASIILVLCLTGFAGCGMQGPTVSASEPHGIISVTGSVRSERIHPVILNRLDGRYMSLGFSRIPPDASLIVVEENYHFTEPGAFFVAPGRHQLVLTAVFRRGDEIKLSPQNPMRGDMLGSMELEVEAGKRYYIGARIVGSRYDQWEPIVYRVESIRGGRDQDVFPDPTPDRADHAR